MQKCINGAFVAHGIGILTGSVVGHQDASLLRVTDPFFPLHSPCPHVCCPIIVLLPPDFSLHIAHQFLPRLPAVPFPGSSPRHPQKQQLLLLSFSLRGFCWLELSLVRWAGGKSRPAGLGKTEACFVSAQVVTVFLSFGISHNSFQEGL